MRYVRNEWFTPPDDADALLWRYIDFTKLVSLLETRSLYFARADTLDDAFEGSLTRATVEARHEHDPDERLRTSMMYRWFRLHTFVNCWSLGNHESAALWRLYVPPEGGVALRSSFRRLSRSFGAARGVVRDARDDESFLMGDGVYIGRVRYADYDLDRFPERLSLPQFVHKRRSFEFEHEVRAVFQRFPPPKSRDEHLLTFDIEGTETRIQGAEHLPTGELVRVSLSTLIDAIHVSPVAPPWFADLVRSVCAKYGLAKPIVQSNLAGEPVY
jgi:hypothetical protein